MKLSNFDYCLPEELIAQKPSPSRDGSRLMVVHRSNGLLEMKHFFDLPEYLEAGDVLVLNDSKVIPARLAGRKDTGAVIEILLIREEAAGLWEALMRPGKRLDVGAVIRFNKDSWAEVVDRKTEKSWMLKFHVSGNFHRFLENNGRAPLPPYIKRNRTGPPDLCDLERYQTVYARKPGSIAAPTAGLHFSEALLEKIRRRDVTVATVTLHVGYGTFLPIEKDNIEEHAMEEESFEVPPEVAEAVSGARRVIAVGTTSVRTLETAADDTGHIRSGKGTTSLFLYPGKKFRIVEGLLTNFHLPRSSLFLLVCAFAGTDLIKQAYATAVQKRFRFYSYGDCMLIV
ncbi:MAG: tRNA preQ1(34) S-adenosylmethionine ribosyltransferase-isomerase QueA [Deltaproteobacteria bacterium]|nr:tRNA preQ1(34) S-adenosylmethionine ribosyltransferase-isomerase QueA [Deltaproteobacteria bacterium]